MRLRARGKGGKKTKTFPSLNSKRIFPFAVKDDEKHRRTWTDSHCLLCLIFYRFCIFFISRSMHFEFSRWNQKLSVFMFELSRLSASIIKTPLHMSADFINDSTAEFTRSFFSAHSKCRANLCFNMTVDSAWCLKAIFLFRFLSLNFKNDLLVCIRMQEEIFLADVSNLSFGKLSATARCCEGCDYAIQCLRVMLGSTYIITVIAMPVSPFCF